MYLSMYLRINTYTYIYRKRIHIHYIPWKSHIQSARSGMLQVSPGKSWEGIIAELFWTTVWSVRHCVICLNLYVNMYVVVCLLMIVFLHGQAAHCVFVYACMCLHAKCQAARAMCTYVCMCSHARGQYAHHKWRITSVLGPNCASESNQLPLTGYSHVGVFCTWARHDIAAFGAIRAVGLRADGNTAHVRGRDWWLVRELYQAPRREWPCVCVCVCVCVCLPAHIYWTKHALCVSTYRYIYSVGGCPFR